MRTNKNTLKTACCFVPFSIILLLVLSLALYLGYPTFKDLRNPRKNPRNISLIFDPATPSPETKSLIPARLDGMYIGMSYQDLRNMDVMKYGHVGPPMDYDDTGEWPADKMGSGYIHLPRRKDCEFEEYFLKLSKTLSLSAIESELALNSKDGTKCIVEVIDFINTRTHTKPLKGLWYEGDINYKKVEEPFYKPDSFRREVLSEKRFPAFIWKKGKVYIMVLISYNKDDKRIDNMGWVFYDKSVFDIKYGLLLNSYAFYPDTSWWILDINEIDAYFNVPEIKQLAARSGAEGYYLPEN